MAQQDITIGAADQGNGDTLFAAFTKVQANFDELYLDDAGDVNSVNGQTGAVVLDSDDIAEGSTNEYYTEAKVSANTSVVANTAKVGITSGQASEITANTAKVTNADHTGEVTGSTGLTITAGVVTNAKMAANSIDSDQYVDGSIDTIHIADNQVTHDKLGTEFTTSSPLTAAADVDMSFSAAQVFTMTSSIAVDINFTNAEIGQVKDLIVTDSGGTSSLTFDTASNTITTIQGTYSATAGAVNFIQVVCTAANTFFLSISQSI